ncbi:MAG: transposase [Gammaproteobacteria bacterium]
MPRANRHFLPGHVWHITHRCHQKDFLLKFSKDRQRWRYWLFEAKKRFGLCVFNYVVTSNHIHLLVRDCGNGEIAKSMQLIAGRTAQEYNLRKGRKGAFWEDRYHATAVDSDKYLARCMVYIDLNMVRAGAVSHPGDWPCSGYCEIQSPPQRYAVIDRKALSELLGTNSIEQCQLIHQGWVENELKSTLLRRDLAWSQNLAVGHKDYVENIKMELGITGRNKLVVTGNDAYALKEPVVPYIAHLDYEMSVLSGENTVLLE